MSELVPTWYVDPKAESEMGVGHAPVWRRMIELVEEQDLTGKTVLDYRCSQGGFLRLLHAHRPFARGLSVDIATESVAQANALKGNLPMQYEVLGDLSSWESAFNVAFSHEVIYLVPDLQQHAADIASLLRPGGVYYAVTGCHTDNPLWPRWRELIPSITHTTVQDRSIQDYANAFQGQGLQVLMRKLGFNGFIPARANSNWFRNSWGEMNYLSEVKVLFRVLKS